MPRAALVSYPVGYTRGDWQVLEIDLRHHVPHRPLGCRALKIMCTRCVTTTIKTVSNFHRLTMAYHSGCTARVVKEHKVLIHHVLNAGDVFNEWTVLVPDLRVLRKSGWTRRVALCRCSCLREFTVDVVDLATGRSTRCKHCAGIRRRLKTLGRL